MNTLNYFITVPYSDYEMLPQRSTIVDIVSEGPKIPSGLMTLIEDIRVSTEPVIPFSFEEGLADCREGRVMDMDDALRDEPPEL